MSGHTISLHRGAVALALAATVLGGVMAAGAAAPARAADAAVVKFHRASDNFPDMRRASDNFPDMRRASDNFPDLRHGGVVGHH